MEEEETLSKHRKKGCKSVPAKHSAGNEDEMQAPNSGTHTRSKAQARRKRPSYQSGSDTLMSYLDCIGKHSLLSEKEEKYA